MLTIFDIINRDLTPKFFRYLAVIFCSQLRNQGSLVYNSSCKVFISGLVAASPFFVSSDKVLTSWRVPTPLLAPRQ